MKKHIIVDDNTKAGAGEDEWLIGEMEKSRKSGEADKNKMLKRFDVG